MRTFDKSIEKYIAQAREQFIRDSLFSDELIDLFQDSMLPLETELAYYRCAIMEVETKFRVLNEQFSLEYDRNPIESIKTRIKSMDSILKKIRKNNVPLTIDAIEEEIRDIAGIRVVCSFPEDIYMLANCLLQQDDVKLLEMKDYIQTPKPSGYRSLHLIIETPIFLQTEKRMMKVEVQLRTIAMDFWASLEHKLRYKKNIPADEIQDLANELQECARISAELDARMESIRNRMNSPEFVEKAEAEKQRQAAERLMSAQNSLFGPLLADMSNMNQSK